MANVTYGPTTKRQAKAVGSPKFKYRKKKHLQSMHLIVETRKPNFPCNSKLRCKLVNLNKEKSHDTCS